MSLLIGTVCVFQFYHQCWLHILIEVSCYEDGLIRFLTPVTSMIRLIYFFITVWTHVTRMFLFQRLPLMTASSSIYLFLFGFGIDCLFRRQLHLTILWYPVTRIAPLTFRLVQIGSSWVYLYRDRNFSIDRFAINFDWIISIDRFSELTRTISINQFSELGWMISICDSCWLLTSGTFFWIMLRVKILLHLSLFYPLYQSLSLKIGSFVVVFI